MLESLEVKSATRFPMIQPGKNEVSTQRGKE